MKFYLRDMNHEIITAWQMFFGAFRAVLIEVKKRPEIKSILCPGLGTAVGQMLPFCCAKQMYEAYKAIWLNEPLNPKNIADIYYPHQAMAGHIHKKEV